MRLYLLEPPYGCCRDASLAELARGEAGSVVVVSANGDVLAETLREAAATARAAPASPVLLVTPAQSTLILGELGAARRLGLSAVIVNGAGLPPVSELVTVARRAASCIEGEIPTRLRLFGVSVPLELERAIEVLVTGRGLWSVLQWAERLDVSERTLVRLCAECGGPRPFRGRLMRRYGSRPVPPGLRRTDPPDPHTNPLVLDLTTLDPLLLAECERLRRM